MIEVINENGILLEYEDDGEKIHVKHEEISRYWDHANEDEIEEIKVHEQGKYLVGLMTVASGQGGIVFAYDTKNKQVAHVSDGSYAVDVKVKDDKVYTLCFASHWGAAPRFELVKESFGIIDAWKEGEVVLNNLEIDADKWDGQASSIELMLGDTFKVMVCGEEHEFSN